MGVAEWVAVGVILVAGALFVGFPVGVAVGYAWRDHISRARRARYLVEQERRHAELRRQDKWPAEETDPRFDVRRAKTVR